MSDNSKFSFKDSVSRQLDDRVKATAPIDPVDAFVFCTSSKYLGERLFPWQSLTIKLYYGLWKKYPLSPEEQDLVNTLESEWKIKLDLEKRDPSAYIEILILVTGRRAGKSSLISFVQTYEAYKLICKGDPQRYYGIRDRHPIQIVNCLTKDSRITLKNGNTKRLIDLSAGDEVMTRGEAGITSAPIKNIWPSGVKEILEIRTGDRRIEASEGHKFYTLLKGLNPAYPRKAGWVEAKDLQTGDYIGVLTDSHTGGSSVDLLGNTITEDIMEQLGLYVGDGYIWVNPKTGRAASIEIALPDTDVKKDYYISQAKSAWNPVGNIGVGRTKYTYRIYSSKACHFILQSGIGQGSKTKTIPDWIFGLQRQFKIAFLNGVIHSDGSENRAGRITIAMSNEELVSKLRELCISVGWHVCNINTYHRSTNYGSGRIWRFVISKEYKRSNKTLRNHPICDGIEWTTIRSIKPLGPKETFDLEVCDTHTFFADGLFVHNCAKDGDQAKDPFLLVKNNIRRIPFFQKYIDTEKDNESEMRLFTPADLYENQQIEEYNRGRQRGSLKKGRIEGSILISAFTTSAAGKRGKAVICLVLDEYAHFDRAKMTGGGMTDEDILNEAPQTDYAMLKAIAPATKDFNLPDRNIFDGKIIMISSPKEKGGEFYNHYCLAGGMEQPNPYREDIEPKYVMLQLSSWQANPRRNRESFDSDFKKDPIGSNMEYGSHFGEPSSAFVNPETVEAMIEPARKMCYFGEHGKQYIIALDPARKMDTYAIAWGHAEGHVYIVDGIHGFRPEITRNPQTGMVFTAPIDPNKIVQFITSLVGSLSAHGRVLEVCFDQFNSSESLNILRAMKVPAVETVFTTKYNGLIYSNLFEKLNTSCVRVFGAPPVGTPPGFPQYQSGWLEQLKLELKFLNRITVGDNVYYEAPSTGPVQTDDFCDALANLVHRLILYNSRDPRIMKEIAKQIGRPVKFGIRSAVQTGGPLFTNTGGAPGRRKLIAQVSERFRR